MAHIDRFTCAEVFQRLDDYLDRELTSAEIQMIQEHLSLCAACASEYRFEESVLRQVRTKLQRLAVPPNLSAKVSRALARVQEFPNESTPDGAE